MKNKLVHWFVIGIFTLLYLFTSVISTIHVVDFFQLSNYLGMAICLAVAFEMGAAASLASIIVLDKMNKGIVWMLFILLTLFQMMGNVYYAYVHLENFTGWIELFGLQDYDIIMQKRVLAILSGAILPIVALGFIKALVDYIRPTDEKKPSKNNEFDDIFNEYKPEENEETFVEDGVETEVEETQEVPYTEPVESENSIEPVVEPEKPAESVVESEKIQPQPPENVIMVEPIVKPAEKAEKEQPKSDEIKKPVGNIRVIKNDEKQSKQARIIPPWPIKTTKANPKK